MIENINQNPFPPFILNHDIEFLSRQAANAIISLQIKDQGTFWRSVEHREKHGVNFKGKVFPTVTFCSVEAIINYENKNEKWSKKGCQLRNFDELIKIILQTDINEFVSNHDTSRDEGLNPFTLARYVHALYSIHQRKILSYDQLSQLDNRLKQAIKTILNIIDKGNSKNWHPYIIYHVVRSIQMANSILVEMDYSHETMASSKEKLMEQIRNIVLQIHSQRMLGRFNPSDAIALGFCAATLVWSNDKNDFRLILPSLEACFINQDKSGSWPEGRVILSNHNISENGGQALIISTYEIAWIMADLLLFSGEKRLISLRLTKVQQYISQLIMTLSYTQISIERLTNEQLTSIESKEPKEGWCADHVYNKPTIESWTSASVLNFLTILDKLVQLANQQLIITNYPYVDPLLDKWPEWQRWDKYRQECEPEEEYKVLDYIDRNIVKSILNDINKVPSKEKNNVSALLFGPPGTHKTSIVLAIAEGLGWPVVTLSPGVFIEKGLEYIEAQANYIFSQLFYLAQTVILFDECDELFRDREPLRGTEQMRSITAFVTAAMLPKMQNLHDNGKVLFFICTNQIESMDKAIIRGGRIDHIVGIGPPDEKARLKILKEFAVKRLNHTKQVNCKEDFHAKVEQLVNSLAKYSNRFSRFELEWAFDLLYTDVEHLKIRSIKKAVCTQVDSMKDYLAITQDEYESFEKNKLTFSRPHIEKKRKK
jgi:hypothetical protein